MRVHGNDLVIDEVRDVHRRISAQFNHDPARLVAYYVDLQKQYQHKLVDSQQVRDKGSGA